MKTKQAKIISSIAVAWGVTMTAVATVWANPFDNLYPHKKEFASAGGTVNGDITMGTGADINLEGNTLWLDADENSGWLYDSGNATLTVDGQVNKFRCSTATCQFSVPPRMPREIDNAPAITTSCISGREGMLHYVDDSNDTVEAYMCFCADVDDGTTFAWRRVADPTAACP